MLPFGKMFLRREEEWLAKQRTCLSTQTPPSCGANTKAWAASAVTTLGWRLQGFQFFHSHAANRSSWPRQGRKKPAIIAVSADMKGKTWKSWEYLPTWVTSHCLWSWWGGMRETATLCREGDVSCWCHPEIKKVSQPGPVPTAAAAGPS